jgi:quercetin dioxygenase-like cupin family protein
MLARCAVVYHTLVLVADHARRCRKLSLRTIRGCRRHLRLIDPAARVWFYAFEENRMMPFESRTPCRLCTVAGVIAASGLVLHMASAQQPGTRRINLQRHDLSVPGREVVQVIVELDPGVTSSRHTHPGEEIVYVLEGAPLEYQLDGKAPVTLRPGDVLFIPAGTIHTAKNVGSRKGAELATYIVEKGKPLLTEVSDRFP